jgi:uncharacterized pyridoxal phosphate-dependent enzyme
MCLAGDSQTLNLTRELSVRKVVNAVGTWTMLGGSLMEPEVLNAMNNAAESFVYMRELLSAAGRVIAEVTGAEAAYVTSGAAAGLVLSAAACITGEDPMNAARLPNTEGMKNEVIVQTPHVIDFVHLLRFAGAKLVTAGKIGGVSERDIERAMSDKTASILYIARDPQRHIVSLEKTINLAKRHAVPVIVDAAAELPPAENLRKFIAMGADLVVFSGGKDIGGPNDSGFVCGRKDLVNACALNGFPNETAIGRTMKISKEQIVGLVTALRRYTAKDQEAQMKRWSEMANWMTSELNQIPHVRATTVLPDEGPRPISIPKVELTWDERTFNKSMKDVVEALRAGDPAVEVAYSEAAPGAKRIRLNPHCLKDGEQVIVVDRLKAILSGHC